MKLIARLTASAILLTSLALLGSSVIHGLELNNGAKEIMLVLIGGSVGFLFKE